MAVSVASGAGALFSAVWGEGKAMEDGSKVAGERVEELESLHKQLRRAGFFSRFSIQSRYASSDRICSCD